MSRARDLSKLGNINVLTADDVSSEVGIATTVPRSTLDVRGEIKVGTAIQAGTAGVLTATSFDGGTSGNVTGAACTFTTGTFNGNVTIGGTLTYEDVTNIDSLGIVTARAGVNVSGGQLQVGVAYSVGAAGVATAAGFVGPLTGAVTGNADTATTATTATNVTVTANNSTDETVYPIFVDGATGSQGAESDTGLTYNPSDGNLTSTTFTGNVVGNQSGGSITATTGSYSSNLTVGSGVTIGSAGVSTFSGGSDLHLVNNVNLYLGNEKDAQILHTGTNFNLVNDEGSIFIQNDATANPDGHIYIRAISGENSIHCADDGQVELYYDNDRKFRTVTSGAQVESTTGDTNLIVMAEEDDSGADALITARVTNDSASSYIMFGDSSDANIGKIRYKHDQDEMLFYTNDTEKWRITSGGNLQNNSDSGKLQLGTSEDLEIYHNGSHSFIDDSGTGNLYIRSGTDNAITLNTDADIILYYDNSIKLQTTNDGTKTTGIGTFTSHVSLPDNAALCLGNRISGTTLGDLRLYHNGSHSYIDEVGTGNLYIRNGTDNAIWCQTDGQVKLYYDNSAKFETTNDGTVTTGISTFSRGCAFNSMLKEEVNIVANKLSAGVNIDIDDGMIWYYSTNETATATPNIRYNSSKSLNNVMSTGQAVTVTIIYKPNGAGYYAALTVDGSGVTEEWNGGAAPSAANAGGYDVLTHTLVKTADATFICLSNVQNYA